MGNLEVWKRVLALLGALMLSVSVFEGTFSDEWDVLKAKIVLTVTMGYAAFLLLRRQTGVVWKVIPTSILTAVLTFAWLVHPTFQLKLLDWSPSVRDTRTLVYTDNMEPAEAFRAGQVHYMKREYPLAQIAFEKALGDDRVRPYALNRLGNTLRVQRDYQRALERYSEAIDAAPNAESKSDERRLQTNNLVNRGWVIRRQVQGLDTDSADWADMQSRALNDFLDATQVDSTFARAWYNAGQVHFDRGEFLAAADMYLKAYFRDPQYDRAAYNLAAVHARRKDTSEAMAWMERAIQIDASWAYRAKNDPDFTNMESDPEWVKLLNVD